VAAGRHRSGPALEGACLAVDGDGGVRIAGEHRDEAGDGLERQLDGQARAAAGNADHLGERIVAGRLGADRVLADVEPDPRGAFVGADAAPVDEDACVGRSHANHDRSHELIELVDCGADVVLVGLLELPRVALEQNLELVRGFGVAE
jgi:hypothetical protein